MAAELKQNRRPIRAQTVTRIQAAGQARAAALDRVEPVAVNAVYAILLTKPKLDAAFDVVVAVLE